MGMDATEAAAALKRVYNDDLPMVMQGEERLKNFPFYAELEKKEKEADAYGGFFSVAVKIDLPETINFAFATGQAKAAASFGQTRYKNFLVTPVVNYGFGRIDGPIAVRAQTSTQAFVDLMAEEAAGARKRLEIDMAAMAFKTGTGSLGTITAAPTSTTITVSKADMLSRFRVNQELVAAAADGTGALRNAAFSRITKMEPQTGVITLSVDPTTLSWANGDFLFRIGEFVADTKTKLVGVGAWNPSATPSATTFFNVDRSNDWQLYGIIYDGAGSSNIRDALIDGIARHCAAGQIINRMYLHPFDWAKLARLVDPAKTSKTFLENQYNVGLEAIMLSGTMQGSIRVYADAGVEPGNAHGLKIEDWYLAYSGDDLVHQADPANEFIMRDGADAFEARFRTVSNLVCERPGGQLRIINI